MNQEVELTINGTAKRLSVDPRRSLLEVIREDLGFTGTKYGCGEGQCRACTVLLDGNAVVSCLLPVTAAHGRRIETIESLAAEGEPLHPVQQAFVDEGAMQCGYCVPGMILTTVSFLRKKRNPTRAEIVEALNGNICRCCGFSNIIKAVERAAQQEGK